MNRDRTAEINWNDRPRWMQRLSFTDVGDYCDWPECPVSVAENGTSKPTPVRFQSRYNIDESGNIVVDLLPAFVNGVAVDFTNPLGRVAASVNRSRPWITPLKSREVVFVTLP